MPFAEPETALAARSTQSVGERDTLQKSGRPPSLLRLFFEFSITCTKTKRLSHNFSDLAEILAIEVLATRRCRGGRPAIRPGGTPDHSLAFPTPGCCRTQTAASP